MAAQENSAYDRDEIARFVTTYYSTLARACYFSASDIQSPPPNGWSDSELDIDALRALRRSDKVIDLLRHIPYIRPYKNGDQVVQWPIFVRSRNIRYLRDNGDFTIWSARGDAGLDELAKLPFGQTPAGPMDLPPNVVALSRGYGLSDFGSPWWLVDCETGVLTPYTSGTGTTDKPWQTSQRSPKDFFEEMSSYLKTKNIIALPPVEDLEPEIMGSESDQQADTRSEFQWIYEARGWSKFEEDPSCWRREECCDALKQFRIELLEADKKKEAYEANFDDPEDKDYNDFEPDAGSEASLSEGESEEEDTIMGIEDFSVDVTRQELAEVWADLDEPEYTMIDQELKEEGVQHSFACPSHPPQRLARAPRPEENVAEVTHSISGTSSGPSIESMVQVVERYYETLSRTAYFSSSLLDFPPDGGWGDDVFPAEELTLLGYSDKAIGLLRHLPYLGLDEDFWEVLPGSQPLRYLRNAELFEGKSRDKLRRPLLRKLGLSPCDDVMPADLVAFSAPNEDSWRGNWWMIDVERGVIFTVGSSEDQRKHSAVSEDEVQAIVPFFERLISQVERLEVVPIPGLGPDEHQEPVIWAEPNWKHGAETIVEMSEADRRVYIPSESGVGLEAARQIYRDHRYLQDDFRRDECRQALVQLRDRTVYGKKLPRSRADDLDVPMDDA